MTDREKLIALYKKWWETPLNEEECEDCMEDTSHCNECLYGKFADYLISNGVVVRDKGEWVGDSKEECPFCGERSKWFYENFCPACGADMRGKHGINRPD